MWIGLVVVLAAVFPLARASAWEDGNTAPTKTLNADTDLGAAVLDAAFDSVGNLYVLNYDAGKKYVNVYSAGNLIGHPVPVKRVELDSSISGIALSLDVDRNGNVYLSVFPLAGILVYDDISTWAADGSTQPIKRLNAPFPLAISLDSHDNLYVVESAQVSVYDDISTWLPDGSTQPRKTLVGNNTGLNSAASVALDNSDNMYVSNGGNNSITVYAAGWLGGDTIPSKTLIGNNTGLDAPGSIAFDASGKMFVSSGSFFSGPIGSSKVLAFATNWPSGNTAPTKTLVGDRTKSGNASSLLFDSNGIMFTLLASPGAVAQYAVNWANGNTAPIGILNSLEPTYIAFDHVGRMYVTDQYVDSVTVYAADWADGHTQPIKILYGRNTGLSSPVGISFDDVGNMYVANSAGYYDSSIPSSITVYGPDWASGDTAPIKTLIGGNTGLVAAISVAFDSHNNMYVANYSSDSVTMYSDGWASGNTAPVKTLIGTNTGLSAPIDLDFDSADNLYVSNDAIPNNRGDTINVFAPGWADGDTAPIAFLRGSDTDLNVPDGLVVASNGKIYVTNAQSDKVNVYGDFTTWAADGNTAPLKTLSGADTGLDGPWGIAFDANGNMYVANRHSVTMYAGEIPPPVTTTTTTAPPTTTIPSVPEVFVLPATL
jgi:6-phosphogluconolactonase (cycloisomerase 2 family)